MLLFPFFQNPLNDLLHYNLHVSFLRQTRYLLQVLGLAIQNDSCVARPGNQTPQMTEYLRRVGEVGKGRAGNCAAGFVADDGDICGVFVEDGFLDG
jgi:hypothetical protein